MSASLVGSEMCIRDRLGPCGGLEFLKPLPQASHRQTMRPIRGPPGREAVSYTHLTLPTICSV
eukprot:5113741-Alexandrium_andersonii.AAC.1